MQVEYKTEKGTICLVKAPEGASDLTYPKVGMINLYFQTKVQSEDEEDNYISIGLPALGFKLIGLTTEVTEEQAKMMVGIVKPHGAKGTYFKEYNNIRPFYATAIQSFKSLMQHLKVYEVNPYANIEEKYFYQRKDEVQSWGDYFVKERIKSQENVGKWILLFKPNEKL